jgi:predicted Zn-dependent protease
MDALRRALEANANVTAWQIQRVQAGDRQSYLVKTEPEARRRTTGETVTLAVFARNGETLGRAAITLQPEDHARFGAKIDEAVYMAGLGGDAPWMLPAAGGLPGVELSDPALGAAAAPATSKEITERWRAAVAATKNARPSSMELFCGSQTTSLENSAGFAGSYEATRVSLLTIMLAKSGERESESISWQERRRAADLDVTAIVRDAADEAFDITRAELPPSGSYPVLIDARDMAALFGPLQQNAGAQALYQKSSRLTIGERLPMEGEGGDPITVISNATLPYGLSSYAFDGDGTPGRRVEIVKDGVFARPWATKQYADYLGVEPTGAWANLELPPGTRAFADLCAGDGPVLHVRSFSWLNPDQARGDFASEIRVGYLYRNGRRTPVKGGTVSGNLFKALGTARFSSERVFIGGYVGPAAVRLEGLSVAGA